MPTPTASALAGIAAIGEAAGFYAVGLLTGAADTIGYESRTASQSGFVGTRSWFTSVGVPAVWLRAQQAVRADFKVEARFGAVAFTVGPPLLLRTSLQVATAYVEGLRTGSILFVAPTSGWYTFSADPSPLGGPRCGKLDLVKIVTGDRDCPTYDVTYSVTWRLADPQDLASAAPRLAIPQPNGALAVLRIRD